MEKPHRPNHEEIKQHALILSQNFKSTSVETKTNAYISMVRPRLEYCASVWNPNQKECLATDANLTADPGVTSSIPARSHTFMEIDHEIFSTVIFLPSAESFKKGCCQLQAKVCARSSG